MRFDLLVYVDHDEVIAAADGRDGADAAQRYANAHPGVKVIAWRIPEQDRDSIAIGIHAAKRIIEPGHRDWGKNAEYRRRYEAARDERRHAH